MSVDFDMELRQPVLLQHMLEREKKTAFSALWQAGCWIISLIKCQLCTNKQKSCRECIVAVVGLDWVLAHNMGKSLLLDKHTLHTNLSVCMCGWPEETNVPIVNDRALL